jgi:hypothetical protein
MFEFKPDFEKSLKRIEAWYEGEILDRPPFALSFPRPENERVPVPKKEHASERERWMDSQFVAERAFAQMRNNVWFGDSMPIFMPNLGPDVFSAFYGCELEFGPSTSWSVPNLHDWEPSSLAALKLDFKNPYFLKMEEMTQALLEVGRGKFIVAYTDLHPGADGIAAFRDPQNLCMDMLDRKAEIQALLDRVTQDFFKVYDHFHKMLSAAGMPSASWLHPCISSGKFHIPSNDFSCMISGDDFEEIFLPGIARECAHMTHNIYHLDGPGALRHLDRIMDVPNLHGIQWVPGAGHDGWRQWVEVYRRIQARGKSAIVYLPAKDLDQFMEQFRPGGLLLAMGGVTTHEEAETVLRKIEGWK